MTDEKLIGTPELIAAISAMAIVIGYILRTLFVTHMEEKKGITTAYLENVRAATEVQSETAKAVSQLADAVTQLAASSKSHDQRMSEQHQQMCKELKRGEA